MMQVDGSIKDWVKRSFPFLVGLIRSAKAWKNRNAFRHERSIINALRMFVPIGPGNYVDIKNLTLLSANQTFPFIQHLLKTLDVPKRFHETTPEEFCSETSERERAAQLKVLFDQYKSDKSTVHNNHLIYARILKRPAEVTAVLEIGLGTNNVDVASNMGAEGQPGASLRAFRDFLPNARIIGADIDKRILFQEERITTSFVDQTDLKSFDALKDFGDQGFDLIIDDGLHSPNANIAVLAFGISNVKVNGWIVIEDICPEALPIWHTVAALLPQRFELYLFATSTGPVFAVRRLA